MYYSSKTITTDVPPIVTHCFQPYGKPLSADATEEQVKAQRELEAQIKFLGTVNDLEYYYVPDDLELVEQPEQAEVTKVGVLDPDVEAELTLNGEYAKQVRYAAALANCQYVTDGFDERKQVAQWQAISDLTDVMLQLAEAMPATLENGNKVNAALANLKRLKAQADAARDKLAKVGL